MTDVNMLEEKDFRFEPFEPSIGGDSGALMLATKLTDENVRFVVKYEFEGDSASEFIYHKIAAALGIYTQEVKLFKKLSGAKYACGIRYSAHARKADPIIADNPQYSDYYRFLALYQILEEEDSKEFYFDENNRLFKLDNAEAFMLSSACYLLINKANTKSRGVRQEIDRYLEICINKSSEHTYRIMAEKILELFGKNALETYLNTFIRFAELDLSLLDEAFTTLDNVYPQTFSKYLRSFLMIRQPACLKFAEEFLP